MNSGQPGVSARLEQACLEHADAIAIVAADGQKISYARLLETVKSFAFANEPR